MKLAAGTVADDKTTSIIGKAVTILGEPGAKLSRTNDGAILLVQDPGADVQIFDLEITGGSGIATPAVYISFNGIPKLTLTRVTIDRNQGIGVLATAGILTMSQSTIRENTGGGIQILQAQFDITNSYIVENGSTGSTLGGLRISQIPPTGTHRLDFNTIAANTGTPLYPLNTGVDCDIVGMSLIFDSNIIFDNDMSGGGKQIADSPMCTAIYSDVGQTTFSGLGNINAKPMFVNPAQGDFHLMGTSPVRDAANPAATLPDDFDGDARPQGQIRDIGADEIKP